MITYYVLQPRLMKETLKNVFLGPYNCGKCLARINHSKHPFVWQVCKIAIPTNISSTP